MGLSTFHKFDTRYKIHCVDCGCLIKEYEKEYLGDHYTRGIEIFFLSESQKIFNGWRCLNCLLVLKNILEERMKNK